MSAPSPVSAPKAPVVERLKSGAAILGAVAGAITGLWGVYEKVRTEAKDLTAASYNTLAPQMNQIGEALKQLQQENQQLREIVAQHQGKPRIAAEPARRPKRTIAGSSSTAPAAAPAAGGPAAAAPPAETAPPAGTAPPPAGTPAAQAPPQATSDPAAAPAAQAPAEPADPVTGLLNTVGRTREAIEGLRKVPESFENVLGKKK